MTIDLRIVDRFPAWVCPHCGQHPEDKFDVLNREACSLDSASPDFLERADFLFWQLGCSSCGKESYLFELTLIGERDQQTQFVADGCWTAQSQKKMICSTPHEKWEHERLEKVTFDSGEKAEWLGIHRFGPFGDFNMGRLRATALFKEVARLAEESSIR